MKMGIVGRIALSRTQLACLVAIGLLLSSMFVSLYQVKGQEGVWWDYSWQFRKKLTIDHTKVVGNLTAFPALIDLSDSDLSSKAQSSGNDIVFTDNMANKLNHEIEFYNSSTGRLIAWVKVPQLSTAVDTILYMYYGNAGSGNQQNAHEVWDSNYVLVEHLREGSGSFFDSSTYGNNGTAVGGVTQGVSGKINGACSFDGSTGYIQVPDSDSLDGMAKLTIEVWVKQSTYHANGIVNKNANSGYELQGWSDQQMYFAVADTGSRAVAPPGSYPLNDWYQLVAVSTGTSLIIYVNGTQRASSSKTIAVPVDTQPVQIGQSGSNYAFFNGLLDEVRISKTARSAEWISTEYNNQNSPSTFYTVGAEEARPAGIAISSETPQNGSIYVALNPTLGARFGYYDLMNITFSTNATGTWQTIGSYQNVGGGGGGGGVFYSVNPTSMNQYKTKYFWKVLAEDSAHNESTTEIYGFTTGLPSAFDPFAEGWQYRKTITINHTNVAANLTNFPVLIDLTDSDLAAHAQASGNDILFTGTVGNTTRLDHEIESYESGTGHLISWIRVPQLSSTTDTVLYMYYGNAACGSQQNVHEVWDSSYVLVDHLREASGSFFDSSTYGNNGTAVGGVTQGASGKINGACSFDGSSGYIQVPDSDSLDGMAQLTIQLWVKQSTYHNNGILNKGGAGSISYLLQGWSDQAMYWQVPGGPRAIAPAGSYPLDAWFSLVAVSAGSQLLIYINGVLKASSTGTFAVPVDSSPVQIGQNGVGAYFSGLLDEVRISKTARSAEWISTEYSNQNNPSTFYTVGSQETPPTGISISDETPQNGAVNIHLNPTLSAYFINYQGLMNITFSTNTTGIWQTIRSYSNVGTGYYSAVTTNMDQYATRYWWRVDAEDLQHGTSASQAYSFMTMPLGFSVSNPSPANESTAVPLNTTQLSFDLSDFEGNLMNYTVATSPNIGTGGGTNVTNGRYSVTVSGLRYSAVYTWIVTATDGKNATTTTYEFVTQPIPSGTQYIGDYACMGLGYMGSAMDKNVAYAVWQGPLDVSPTGVAVWSAKFDKTQGWTVTNQSVFGLPWGERHPFYGYWGGKYHVCWFDGAAARMAVADSSTFEGFQAMNGSEVQYYLPGSIPGNSVPSAYAFNDSYAWIMGSDTSTGDEAIAYWAWNLSTGWSSKNLIMETANASHGTNFPALLTVNETTWYIYYTAYPSPGLYYVESADQGKNWSQEYMSNIASDVSSNSRPSFARYGNNFYIFLIDTLGQVVIYDSTDGQTWGNKQVLDTAGFEVAQGYAVDQKNLVWIASNTTQYKTSSQGHYGVGDENGGVFLIPEMQSSSNTPALSYPSDGMTFESGTSNVQLGVVVHGSQVYDVAFYWANGMFIGEDKLLAEGDTAAVTVSGLSDGQTYQWYAVARGATYGYWGGQPATTTDEKRTATWAFTIMARRAPYILNEDPQNRTSNVPVSTSTLSFTISDPQSYLMNYTVTTYPGVGSGSGINLGNGTYTVSIGPLMSSRIYTWYINVTDGTYSTSATFTFSTAKKSVLDPFEEGWGYRKKITINHTNVAANLTNFPVLIDLTDSDLAAHAQASGNDLLFTDASGVATELSHEMETYNGTTGRLMAWVKVPQLSSTIDTTLYMYYGNPYAINQQDTHGVWDSSYVLVEHMREASGTVFDSSSYGNNGTVAGGVSQGVGGKINGACSFDGSSGYIQVPDSGSLDGMAQLTIQLWAKQPTNHPNGIVSKNGDATYLLQGWGAPYEGLYFIVNGQSSRAAAPPPPLNEWYYLAAVSTGTQLLIYVNGTQTASSSKTTTVPVDGSPVQIGTSGVGAYFSGLLDEVRISKTARSAEWISTEYSNQNNPSTFYTVGSEEQRSRMRVSPAQVNLIQGEDCVVQVMADDVTDLYGWEFQLGYNQTILNVTSASVVSSGLNEPTNTYYSLIDQANGHLWWTVTTTYPTTTGLSYLEHAILEIHFRAMGIGTSDLGLYGTLMSQSDGSPISHVITNGSVMVAASPYDLATTNIAVLNGGCMLYANDTYANGTAYYYSAMTTIQNFGSQNTGSFYVKLEAYWVNGSYLETSQEIQVPGLAAGAIATINFTNLFHPTHAGLYRFTVTADSRNNITEGNKVNNVLVLNNISVTVIGDINGDGTVNIKDAVMIAHAWGATPTSPQWNIKADLNHDGTIGLLDATRLSLHWGEGA